MTDHAAILARLHRLREQGRRPELTLGDAARVLKADAWVAKAALDALIAAGTVRRADVWCGGSKTILYQLAEVNHG
jgi:hypothetical protein